MIQKNDTEYFVSFFSPIPSHKAFLQRIFVIARNAIGRLSVCSL